MANIFVLFDVWGVQRPISQAAIRLKKHLYRKETVLLSPAKETNGEMEWAWSQSKSDRELISQLENNVKTCRIPGVRTIEDIYKVILLCFHVIKPSSPRLGHCMIAVHHYKGG